MSRWYRNLTQTLEFIWLTCKTWRGISRPPETNRERFLRQQRRKHQR